MNAGNLPGARVALVHDWLNQVGGAENVLEELVSLFPAAPVYTSFYAPDRMPPAYRGWDIRTTYMQKLPGIADQSPTLYAALSLGVWQPGPQRFRPGAQQQERLLPRRTHKPRRPTRRACLLLPDAHTLHLALRPVPIPRTDHRRRGHARAAQPGPAAPLGLRRGPTRRPLHRHQQRHPGAHSEVSTSATAWSSTRPWIPTISRHGRRRPPASTT